MDAPDCRLRWQIMQAISPRNTLLELKITEQSIYSENSNDCVLVQNALWALEVESCKSRLDKHIVLHISLRRHASKTRGILCHMTAANWEAFTDGILLDAQLHDENDVMISLCSHSSSECRISFGQR